MVSALGDIRVSSSGGTGIGALSCSREASGSPNELLNELRVKLENPKLCGSSLNRWIANPGDGGGRKKDVVVGDMTPSGRRSIGSDSDVTSNLGIGPGSRLDCGIGGSLLDLASDDSARGLSKLNRPNLPGSFSSSFSDHEKVDGAEEGPGEIESKLGVEFPRACAGLFSGLSLPGTFSFSSGKGAVRGSLGLISIASAERVRRCLVGLLPLRGPPAADRGSRFFITSFWKSCRQYMRRILGLIHLLFFCAEQYASLTVVPGF